MKILPVGGQLFHADGQAGITKGIVVIPDFANAPEGYADTHVISKPKLQEGAILAFSCGHLPIQHCNTSIRQLQTHHEVLHREK